VLFVLGIMNPSSTSIGREFIMGKYFIGWLLGIPAVVLVILYFIFG